MSCAPTLRYHTNFKAASHTAPAQARTEACPPFRSLSAPKAEGFLRKLSEPECIFTQRPLRENSYFAPLRLCARLSENLRESASICGEKSGDPGRRWQRLLHFKTTLPLLPFPILLFSVPSPRERYFHIDRGHGEAGAWRCAEARHCFHGIQEQGAPQHGGCSRKEIQNHSCCQ